MVALLTEPMYDYGSRLTVKRDVKKLRFGDMYSQRSRSGTKRKRKLYAIKYSRLTTDEMTAVLDFFEDLGGVTPFTWTPEGFTEAGRFVEDRAPVVTHKDYEQFDVTVTVEQVFDSA